MTGDNDIVKGVRARHKSARPKSEIDPAWANAEADIGFLLKEYDWMRLDRDGHQKIATAAMNRADAVEAALRFANAQIGRTPHGDNCFLTDEFPGNQCLCGKISALAEIDSALQEPEQGCEYCGSLENNPKCPACQGIER